MKDETGYDGGENESEREGEQQQRKAPLPPRILKKDRKRTEE